MLGIHGIGATQIKTRNKLFFFFFCMLYLAISRLVSISLQFKGIVSYFCLVNLVTYTVRLKSNEELLNLHRTLGNRICYGVK